MRGDAADIRRVEEQRGGGGLAVAVHRVDAEDLEAGQRPEGAHAHVQHGQQQ